jgi:hypothetical protein
MVKPIIYLVLIIAVSALGAIQYFGDGLFSFKAKAQAEAIVEESRQMVDMSEVYALNYGDGEVDYGNVSEGEDLLMYIKDKGLLIERAGAENEFIESWDVDEETGKLKAVVKNEKVCQYINLSQHNRPISESTPECGTPDAEGLSCCFEEDTP